MGGKRDYLKLLPWQSEFDHQYACWAQNQYVGITIAKSIKEVK